MTDTNASSLDGTAHEGTADGTGPSPTGVRGVAARGYRWALLLFLLLGVIQIFLAGLGVFDLRGQEMGAPGETALDPHRMMGMVLSVLALVIVILAAVARPGRRAIVFSLVLLLLTTVVQSLLAGAGEDTAFFGGLHALDGLAILGIAGYLRASARRGAAA
jgi:hypothetical protein